MRIDVMRVNRTLMLFCLLVSGVMILPASATDDMPEVLRFARQYSRDNPGSVQRPVAEKKERGSEAGLGTGLSRRLARSELIRRQQQMQLKALEEKLQAAKAELNAIKRPEGGGPGPQGGQVVTSRTEALNRDLAAATEKQAALAKQVTDLQQEKEALLKKAEAETQAQQTAREKAETALKVKSDELASRMTELTAARQQTDALMAEKTALEKTVQTLQQQEKVQKAGELVSLKTASQRQAYAAGVMYARDVREAQDGNRLLGVNLDSAALMAGLNDALSGQPLRLEGRELAAAGHELEKVASEGFRTVTERQKKQAEAWLKTFRKGKGVAQDKTGFWYQVTYEGDGERLKPEDTVDVVVEESLTNGKVVSDMDRAGSSLRQKVSEFPPVFAAGLSRLKTHGQITLVVPPELAYGDKGYPPDVPPGATMIYRIRVADRIAEGEVQSSVPGKKVGKTSPVVRQAE
ncbi:hypothetical protein ITK37_004634 [Salmonella enterica]|nr:hypothetical protein [Salmonella enterica]